MDVARKLESYTIEDIYALPDGERAELIDGKIYYMAPPSRMHQKISGDLFTEIHNYIKSNKFFHQSVLHVHHQQVHKYLQLYRILILLQHPFYRPPPCAYS